MQHDNAYLCGQCFHIKAQWIFASGPSVKVNVVQRLTTRIKEYSNDAFSLVPLSCIIKNGELNPFTSALQLRAA